MPQAQASATLPRVVEESRLEQRPLGVALPLQREKDVQGVALVLGGHAAEQLHLGRGQNSFQKTHLLRLDPGPQRPSELLHPMEDRRRNAHSLQTPTRSLNTK